MDVLLLTIPLLLVGFTIAVADGWRYVEILGPYIAAVISVVMLAIGRFMWRNHNRSSSNENRLSRYGRAIFGDDKDDTSDGLIQDLNALEERVEELERRIDND